MSLPDLSIKRPVFISMVLLSIVIFGAIAFKTVGVDLYPRIDFPVVTVVSTLTSADPETMELAVTDPIEEALSSVNSIKHLRSISADGISQVIVEFELEKEIHVAYEEVQTKIAALKNKLPQDIVGPVIEKFDVDAAPILTLIVSGSLPIDALTHLVDKEVEQTLRKVPQIGQIKMIGGVKKKIWLWVNRNQLEAYQLSFQEVEAAIAAQHIDLPAGRITTDKAELVLKTKGEFQTVQEFENLIVATRNGIPILFKEIGHVEEGLEEKRSHAQLNKNSAVALQIGRQSGANSVEVAHRIKEEIAKLQPKLEKLHAKIDLAQDNSTFIEHSVNEVRFHLLFGGALAILIVLLFLRNVRSTLVCALALPTAVIGTFGFMAYMGFSQNMMTLLALSIAIGLLIDDAIVVQENIIRYLEEGHKAPDAASLGSREITLAVLATTLSVVAVFVPVAFMKGVVGRFFYQFGLTVSFAVLISMFVSFTLNPMLSSKILRPMNKGRVYLYLEGFFRAIEERYAALLKFGLRSKAVVLGIALFAFIAALFLGKFLRFEFVPLADQSEFMISLKAPQESSLNYTLQALEKIEEKVKAKPWVEYLFTTIGNDALRSVNAGSIYVRMLEKGKRNISQEKAMREMREELGLKSEGVITIEAVPRMSGGGRKMVDLQFEIRGPSLDELSRISSQLVQKMKGSKGYVDIVSSLESGKPQLDIAINKRAAADFHISPLLIARTLKNAFGGLDITTFKQEGDRYDVTLRLDAPFRSTQADLNVLSIKTDKGVLVPLSNLVELRSVEGPTQIDRYGRVRQVTLFANLNRSEKVLGEAMKEIDGFMQELKLPAGYSYDFTGAANSFKESFKYLVFALLLAVVLVYMVLAAQFESLLHPFIIMLSLPLSIVGAIGALVLFGKTMTIFTMIGIIMLMGLVTKNGILLVDFINTLQRKEGINQEEAIIQAGVLRLRPILMTTCAVVFGMLPIAIGTGTGSETNSPMATAVIGGLITSTLLTLLVVPVAYRVLQEFQEKKLFSSLVKRTLARFFPLRDE